MFVFFEFFAPFFEKLWINHPSHLAYTPARASKSADTALLAARVVARESLELPTSLYLRLHAAAYELGKKSGVNIYP